MARKKSKSKHFMQRAFGKHPGKLHRRLGVPEGQKIPASKLKKAAQSEDPSLRKEAALAKVGKRFGGGEHKSKGKKHGKKRSRR